MKVNFKKDFWFGTATSGPQTEGSKNKKQESLMDFWSKSKPTDFYDQVNSELTSDVLNKWREDIDLMSEYKLNSFRTSIQWSRVISSFPFDGKLDKEAVKFYREYFSYVKSKNIKLIVNLYHFDIPMYLQGQGGWESKYVIEEFVKYSKACFKEFGDIVDYWATFNEPIVPAEAGYLYGWHYPYIRDFEKAVQVVHNMMVAHAKTIQVFRKIFKNNKDKKITIILNLTPSYPKSNSEEDVKAATTADIFFNNVFIDVATKGIYSKEIIDLVKENNILPYYDDEELEIMKNNTVDFLGVNYYQPRRIQKKQTPTDELAPEKYFDTYDWPEKRINSSRGWEIYPKALYDIAINIKENYNNIPWLVCENGIGIQEECKLSESDIQINDEYRIDFFKEHLYWLNKAIEEGSNCFGYQVWTFLDCWSWANAYKNRYGLVSVNLKTQKRTPKKSSTWFKELCENNSFEIDENLIK